MALKTFGSDNDDMEFPVHDFSFLSQKEPLSTAMVGKNTAEDDYQCCESANKAIIFDSNRGEWICSNCGVVHEQGCIDSGKDWRTFSMDENDKRSRCGSPANRKIFDNGLSTRIGSDNRDYNGVSLSATMSNKIKYLRKIDDHAKPHHSMYNNYANAIADLEKISLPNCLDLSHNLQEQVSLMYKKLLTSCFFKNYNSHFILLALTYRVCQEQHDIRTIYEITTKGKIKTRKFTEYLTRILDFFELTPIRTPPEDYLKRIVNKIKLENTQIYLLAKKICKFVENIADKDIKLTTGKEPAGIAGASLYLACKVFEYPCTQRTISKAINITEVTIRGRLNDILRVIGCPPEEYWGKLKEWNVMPESDKLQCLTQYTA